MRLVKKPLALLLALILLLGALPLSASAEISKKTNGISLFADAGGHLKSAKVSTADDWTISTNTSTIEAAVAAASSSDSLEIVVTLNTPAILSWKETANAAKATCSVTVSDDSGDDIFTDEFTAKSGSLEKTARFPLTAGKHTITWDVTNDAAKKRTLTLSDFTVEDLPAYALDIQYTAVGIPSIPSFKVGLPTMGVGSIEEFALEESGWSAELPQETYRLWIDDLKPAEGDALTVTVNGEAVDPVEAKTGRYYIDVELSAATLVNFIVSNTEARCYAHLEQTASDGEKLDGTVYFNSLSYLDEDTLSFSVPVSIGKKVTLQAEDGTNAIFDHWEIITGEGTATNENMTITRVISEETTFRAVFHKKGSVNLSVNITGGRGEDVPGAITWGTKKASQTPWDGNPTSTKERAYYFTATPSEGYTFTGWYGTVNGATKKLSSTATNYNYRLVGDSTLEARFHSTARDLALSVELNQGVTAKYMLSGGDWQPLPEGGEITGLSEGTKVTLQATPEEDFSFDGWFSATGTLKSGGSLKTSVTMGTKSTSVSAKTSENTRRTLDEFEIPEGSLPYSASTRSKFPWSYNAETGEWTPGNKGVDYSVSTLAIQVQGGGEFSFQYQTSTEEECDVLLYKVGQEILLPAESAIADNAGQKKAFSGKRDWTSVTIPIAAENDEETTVFLTYLKDDSSSAGSDLVWVRDITFQGMTKSYIAVDYDGSLGSVTVEGQEVTGTVTVELGDSVTFVPVGKTVDEKQGVLEGWFDGDGTELTKNPDGSYTYTAPADRGEYRRITALFTTTDEVELSSGDGLTVTTKAPFWTESDGVYSPGNIGIDSSVSNMAARVTKSGLLRFSYQLTTEKNYDMLLYKIGDSLNTSNYTTALNYEERAEYSGTTDGWVEDSILVEEGQTVYFAYRKDGSRSAAGESVKIKDLTLETGDKTVTLATSGGGAVTGLAAGANSVPIGQTVTLEATGEGFYGWVCLEDGARTRFLSPSPEYSFQVVEDISIEGVFGDYTLRKGAEFYEGLSELKSGSGTYFLVKDTALAEDLTLPAGVTLVLPFSLTDTTGYQQGGEDSRVSWMNSKPAPYRVLTIPDGKTLTVQGNLIIGGVQHGKDQQGQGRTSGAYAQIVTEGDGTLLVRGGTLTNYGRITGDGITELESGVMKTPYVVTDYSGGTNTQALYKADTQTFPFGQYATVNVQNRFVMRGGATLTGMTSLYFWSAIHQQDITLVGTGSGLIHLPVGSTLEAAYDPDKAVQKQVGNINLADFGKSTVTITGGATGGAFDLQGYGSNKDGGRWLNIPYTYDLILKDGDYTIPTSHLYRVMPGASLTVAEGAALTVENGGGLQSVDGWRQADKSGKLYPSSTELKDNGFSQSGALMVDGTLTVESGGILGGVIQSSGATGKVDLKAGARAAESFKSGSSTGYTDNSVSYSLPARAYDGESLVQLAAGNAYQAVNGAEWALASYAMRATRLSGETVAIGQKMTGTWLTAFLKITFDLNYSGAGDPPDPVTIARGEKVPLPSPQREGYTLTGWYTDSGLAQAFDEDSVPSQDLTLYAGWRANEYTLSFHVPEGASVSPASKVVTYGQPYGELPTPSRAGYAFGGWYPSETGGTQVQPDDTVSILSDADLYARWTLGDFTITYDLAGGAWPQGVTPPESYTVESESFAIPAPERAGYTFLGWTGANGSEPQATVTVEKGGAGNKTYTAHWRANRHTVAWEGLDPVSVAYGETLEPPEAVPVRAGYRFDGWGSYPASMPDEDVTVAARWTSYLDLLEGLPDFDSGNLAAAREYYASLTPDQLLAYDQRALFAAIKAAEEKTIAGEVAAAIPATNAALGSIGSLAAEGEREFIVTLENPDFLAREMLDVPFLSQLFAYEGVSAVKIGDQLCSKEQMSIMLGVARETLAEAHGFQPTDSGFDDWLRLQENTLTVGELDGKYVTARLLGTTPEGVELAVPYTLYFVTEGGKVEKPILVTLTYETNGGSAIPSVEKEAGKELAQPEETTRTGYAFAGWYADEGLTEPWTATVMPSEDTTVYAKWTPHRYTVILRDVFGGQADVALSLAYGEAAALPDHPFTRDGYFFAGWNTDPNGGGSAYAENAVIKNLTAEDGGEVALYAQWSGSQFTVVWRVNGEEIREKYAAGATLTAPTAADYVDENGTRYTATGTWEPALPATASADAVYTAGYTVQYEAAIGGVTYGSLKLALARAQAGDTVSLASDATLTEDAAVPAGVTLLLPCKEDDPGLVPYDNGEIFFNPSALPEDNVSGKLGVADTAVLYRTLTVPEGVTLTVSGTMIVNAVTGRPFAGHYDQDVTMGYAQVDLSGAIVVENGGTLESFGYIRGGGSVTAKRGGVVGDLFVVRNWRGGSQAEILYRGENNVYPINEYDMRNISCLLRVDAGAKLNGLVKMFASGRYYVTRFPQVDGENGLIRLTGTNGYVLRAVSEDGRELYELHGGAAFSRSSLPIVGVTLSTGGFVYPVDGDLDFVLSGGGYTVTEDFKLLPGATVTVREDASLTVAPGKTLVLYDKFQDKPNTDGTQYPADRSPATLTLEDGASFTNQGTFAGTVLTGSANIQGRSGASWAATVREANGYRPGNEDGERDVVELPFGLSITRPGHTWRLGGNGWQILWDGEADPASSGGGNGGGSSVIGGGGGGSADPAPADPEEETPAEEEPEPTEPEERLFRDVESGKWYSDKIAYVAERGIMNGVGDGNFAPNTVLNRAMIAQILYNLDEGEPVDETHLFGDVEEGRWYAKAVNWAAEEGIVSGVGDGQFAPEQGLTREQMAVVLYNYCKARGYDVETDEDLSAYTDSGDTSRWAKTAMSWAVRRGLISGTGGGRLSPKASATRAQVAAVIALLCQEVLELP